MSAGGSFVGPVELDAVSLTARQSCDGSSELRCLRAYSRENGPCHPLHASAQHREHNAGLDLIFPFFKTAQLLRQCYRCRRFEVRIPDRPNRSQCRQPLVTAATFLRSRPRTKLRRWAPPFVTRFDAIP